MDAAGAPPTSYRSPPRRRAHHPGTLDRQPLGSVTDSEAGFRIRSVEHAYTKDGGLAVVLYETSPPTALIIKSVAGTSLPRPARPSSSNPQEEAVAPSPQVSQGRRRRRHCTRAPRRPRMQEMLYPTSPTQGPGLGQEVASSIWPLRRHVRHPRTISRPRPRPAAQSASCAPGDEIE